MRRQKGFTLSGFLLWSVVLVFVALLGFKIGPPYIEYLSIQAQLKAVANDPEGRSGIRRVVEDLFDRRSAIENITSVRAKDILITKRWRPDRRSASSTRCACRSSSTSGPAWITTRPPRR